MPANTPAKSAVAKKRLRNELGYFVSVKTAGDSKSTNAGKNDDLIDIKVKNPLHKIVQILESIKSHQATSFNMHFSIPLVALPIFIIVFLGVFQLGRAQVSCFPTFTSKIGTLKTISVLAPKEPLGFFSSLFSLFLSLPKITSQNNLKQTSKSLLISQSNEPISVIKPDDLNIINYEGQTVIISGNFSQCTNSITLDNKENINQLR